MPNFSIDLGKYRLPDDLRPEKLGPTNMDIFIQKAPDFFLCWVLEASNKLFLTSYSYYKAVPH
jgi:hypothetical protein